MIDYVRLKNPIDRLVFNWVRLNFGSIRYAGYMGKLSVSVVLESDYWYCFGIGSLFPGHALKCNACRSFKSWDECKSKNIEKNCSFTEDHCYAWYSERYFDPPVDAKLDHYVKGCFTSFECKKGICQTLYPSWDKCHLECCQEDLCNKYQDSQNEDLVPRIISPPGKNWTNSSE